MISKPVPLGCHWFSLLTPGRWVAALPPIVMGLGSELALLAGRHARPYLAAGIWAFTAIALMTGGLLALLRRLPAWGWTWTGAALMALALTLQVLAEELAETGQFIFSPAGDMALLALILLAGLWLLAAAARRGWEPAALVSLGFCTVFGLAALVLLNSAPLHRVDLALLALPAGLIFAVMIAAFLRAGNLARAGLLACAWLLNAGILVLYQALWVPWLVQQGRPAILAPLLAISTGLALAGPLAVVLLRQFRRLLGRP